MTQPSRRALLAAGAAAVVLVPLSAAYAGSSSNLTGLTGSATVAATSTVAQLFTATQSGELTSVTVPLQGPDQHALTLAVESVVDGRPSGVVLGSSPFALTGLAAAPAYLSVPIAGVSVTSGTAYALVMSDADSTAAWGANDNPSMPLAMVEDPTAPTPTWSPAAHTTMGMSATVLTSGSTVSVDTDLVGSSLGLQSVTAPALPTVRLSGADQVTPAVPMPIEVADATGSGAGWQISLQTTPFTSQGHRLPDDTVQVAVPAAAQCAADASGCTPGAGSAATVTATPGQPEALFDAAPGTGMGLQTITPTVRLKIPAGAYAGTYSSDWTVSVSSGP